jgi:hypothetical protein
MQRAQRARLARHQETAARVAVEAMHELQGLLGAQRPQYLDDAKAEPAAAVDRNPGGLVDDEEPFVLDDDRAAQPLQKRPGNTARGPFRVEPHGRHADLVVHGQTLRRIGSVAVDAHLPLAHQAVHAAARQRAE